MFRILSQSLFALTLLITQVPTAEATVRLVPRDDYGKSGEGFFGFTDVVLDRVGAFGQHRDLNKKDLQMGGAYDLIMQLNSDAKMEVFECPTMRQCLAENPNDPAKCENDPKYWTSCDLLFRGPVGVMCERYIYKHRGDLIFWTGANVVTGLMSAEVITIPRFIDLALQAAGYYKNYQDAKEVFYAKCSARGMDRALALQSLPVNSKTLVQREAAKNQIDDMVTLFDRDTTGAKANPAYFIDGVDMTIGDARLQVNFQLDKREGSYIAWERYKGGDGSVATVRTQRGQNGPNRAKVQQEDPSVINQESRP